MSATPSRSAPSPRRLARARLACFVCLAWAACLAQACSRSEGSSAPLPAKDAKPNATASAPASATAPPQAVEKVVVPAVTISDRAETTVHVAWSVPAGTAVNDDAPFHVRWSTSEGLAEVPPEQRAKGRDVSTGFDVRVVAAHGAPEALLAGVVELVVCDAETHAVCVPVKRRLEMPFLVGKDPKPRAERTQVTLPKAR